MFYMLKFISRMTVAVVDNTDLRFGVMLFQIEQSAFLF